MIVAATSVIQTYACRLIELAAEADDPALVLRTTKTCGCVLDNPLAEFPIRQAEQAYAEASGNDELLASVEHARATTPRTHRQRRHVRRSRLIDLDRSVRPRTLGALRTLLTRHDVGESPMTTQPTPNGTATTRTRAGHDFRDAIWLDGYDDQSIWGYDTGVGSFFAQVWSNDSDSEEPDLWLTPPDLWATWPYVWSRRSWPTSTASRLLSCAPSASPARHPSCVIRMS